MKTLHTPGPWNVIQAFDQMSFPQTTLCDIRRSGQQPFFVHADFNDHGSSEADARLIAAAPELLQALQLAMSTPQNEWDADKRQFCLNAIAKAIGEKEGII